ncbi:unnamed protein product [Symbiodinium natans]|uniref:Uncharacterized protein n=1 Tax=Symbiodinium natans TaxID=878477 RepID=A0A812RZZ9_9DINO|nr:unnamed protein product [Symbiodinium natans]
MPNTQGPANVGWRSTTLQPMDPSLLHAAGDRTPELLQELLPQELANSLWDLGTSDCLGVPITACVGAAVSQRAAELDCRGPANAVRSSTVLRASPVPHAAFAGRLPEASAQDASNRARRMAAASIREEASSAAIADEFFRKRGRPIPQNTANRAWAVATTSLKNRPPSAAISATCIEEASQLAAREVANTLWALRNAAEVDLSLCEALDAALRAAHQTDPQGVANVAWAFATLLVQPTKELLEHLGDQVLRRLSEHDPQNCSNTMRAHGVPVVVGGSASASSAKRTMEVIRESDCQSLANTGWSLTNTSAAGAALLSAAEEQVLALTNSFDISTHTEKELVEVSMGLLGVVWAYAFLEVSCKHLRERCRALLTDIGRTLDRRPAAPAGVGSRRLAACSSEARQRIGQLPHLLA